MTALIAYTKLALNIMWLGCVIAVACTCAVASTTATRLTTAASNTVASLRSRFAR